MKWVFATVVVSALFGQALAYGWWGMVLVFGVAGVVTTTKVIEWGDRKS